MPSLTLWLACVSASCALIILPGPAVLYILATSMTAGRRAALGATAGVEVGALVHVIGAVVGVSALIAASATAFTVIKLLGAGYLLYLAARAFLSRDPRTVAQLRSADATVTPRTAFRSGLLVGSLNPKTAIFFVAFLPQFVDPHAGSVSVQLAVLGLTFVALATVLDSVWAVAGSVIRRRLGNFRMRWLDRTSGLVFVALAAFSLTARRTTS